MFVFKRIIKKLKTSRLLKFFFKNVLYGSLRLLIATYRLRIVADRVAIRDLGTLPGVYYFWHQQIIAGMTFFFKMKAVGHCIVSPSDDGKIAGFLCQKLGFSVLYGSSYKGSLSLVRNALRVLAHEKKLCVVGDGSRGPAFVLQPGLSYLAEKSGVPLIFVECSSSWHITFSKSWDKFQVPLPFSTIYVHIHMPLSLQQKIV